MTNTAKMLSKVRQVMEVEWTISFPRCSVEVVVADNNHKDLRKASQSNTLSK